MKSIFESGLGKGISFTVSQHYVQKFSLIYCCVTLIFSGYFTPQDFVLKTALIVNILLFLIGAPFWFRNTSVSPLYLNIISQISNCLASVWICSYLGPTSHVNLVAIPQFVLVFMMFGEEYLIFRWLLGLICLFLLSLPLFPFVSTWYIEKRMPETELIILRQIFDFTVLGLTTYQVKVIIEAWREALVSIHTQQQKALAESEWRYRLLRILGHDIKEPMVVALQLIRKLRRDREPNPLEAKTLNQLENSQLMIREIISNVQAYAEGADRSAENKDYINLFEVIERLKPWLKSRLEEKNIRLDTTAARTEDPLFVETDPFIYQIFLNILSNAIKFSPPQSVLIFKTGADQNNIYWEISDQGKGISDTELAADNFQSQRAHAPSGSGLGIKIIKMFAERSSLEVQWKSTPSGTTVMIRQNKL